MQIGKDKIKYLYTYNMILYLKNPKNFTKKLLDTIKSFSIIARYKINLQTL
jgi:hypothetical protein